MMLGFCAVCACASADARQSHRQQRCRADQCRSRSRAQAWRQRAADRRPWTGRRSFKQTDPACHFLSHELRQTDYPADAAKPDVAGGCIHRLGMARGGTIAPAIARCAQMRAALQHLARNPDLRLARIETGVLARAARVLRNAAGLRDIRFVPVDIPVGGPFPGIADHVVNAVAVGRKRRHRRGARETIACQILVREIRPARYWRDVRRPASVHHPRRIQRRRARRARRIPTRLPSAGPCRPSAHRRAHRE